VLAVVFGFVLAATALFAGSKPVAVSPGDASKLVLIGDICPTFSWGQVDGARSYELVVYGLGGDGEEAKPVLRQTVAGSASSWTPALDHCLERGGQYAWSVRSVGREDGSDWSAPALFQVAAPTVEEFQEALEVVRQYLGTQAGVEATGGASTGATAESEPSNEPTTTSPVPAGAATTQLSVDGGVVATSFTGDGSTLTDLDPANLAPGIAGIDIGGTATTASDLSCTGCVSFNELDAGLAQRVSDLEASLMELTDHITVDGPAGLRQLRIEAFDVEIVATGNTHIAGATTQVEASGIVNVTGGLLILNQGSRPVSGPGDVVIAPGGTGTILTGSETVLIP
jgi:hypothetical protein